MPIANRKAGDPDILYDDTVYHINIAHRLSYIIYHIYHTGAVPRCRYGAGIGVCTALYVYVYVCV